MRVVSKILWAFSGLGALFGGANFLLTYIPQISFRRSPDISAPQLAALAAECLTYAIIPYVLARSRDGLSR